MADIRIKDLPTTATQTASDDFIALDGTVNGTRKIDASAPSFKTSVTSPSVVAPAATNLTLAGGSTGASLVLGQGANASATIATTGSGGTSLGTGATQPLKVGRNSDVIGYTSISFNNSLSTNGLLGFSAWNGADTKLYIQHQGSGIEFRNAGATVAFLNGNGNLLIGTTTDGGQKLQVNGTASFAGAVTVNGAGTFGSSFGKVTVSQWSDATNYGAITLNGNTTAAGSLGIGGGASGDSNLYLNAPTGGKIESRINGTAALTINSNQAATFAGAVTVTSGLNNTLSVGASSPANPNPYTTLNGLRISGGDTGNTIYNGSRAIGITSDTGTSIFIGRSNGTTGMSVDTTTGAATFASAVTVGGSCYIGSSSNTGVVILDTPTGLNAQFQMLRGSSIRWNMFRNTATESGSNVGSDWILNRYSDAGADLGVALQVTRSNGVVNISSTNPSTGAGSGALQVAGGIYSGAASVFGGAVTVNGGLSIPANTFLSIGTFGGATGFKQDTPTTDSIEIWNKGLKVALIAQSQMTMLGAAGGGRFVNFATGTTSASLRWVTGANGTAESGSNAGSDYQIHRYSDAGASLGTAFSITRSTGAATFAGAVTVNSSITAGTGSLSLNGSSGNGVNIHNTLTSGVSIGAVPTVVGILSVRPVADGIFNFRNAAGLGSYTGGAIDMLNDASNTVTNLTIRAAETNFIGVGATKIASTTPSTGAGSGALQVAGGIYSGAASVFGGAVTAPSATIKRASTSEDAFTNFYTGGSPYWTVGLQAVGTSNDFRIVNAQSGNRSLSISTTTEAATFAGLIFPQQAASAPTYVKGAIYFDTTLNKLRVGGATAWETVTSV